MLTSVSAATHTQRQQHPADARPDNEEWALVVTHTHTHTHARLTRAETNASPHITLYNRAKIMTKDKDMEGEKKAVGVRTAGGNKSPVEVSSGPCLCEDLNCLCTAVEIITIITIRGTCIYPDTTGF